MVSEPVPAHESVSGIDDTPSVPMLHSQETARSSTMEEGGDDVKSAWPLWAGLHTCYNGNYNRKQGRKAERIQKDCLSSDCSLQLENMKLESLVIADQHAAVNTYPGPVHTARHTLGIGFAQSIDQRSPITASVPCLVECGPFWYWWSPWRISRLGQ